MRPVSQPLFQAVTLAFGAFPWRLGMKRNADYFFMELIQILHIPFGDAQLGSMLTVPPDWRGTRRVSELRTEPLWGLQCDRSESQAALFFKNCNRSCAPSTRRQRVLRCIALRCTSRTSIHCLASRVNYKSRLITASANCSVESVPPMSPVFSPSCSARS